MHATVSGTDLYYTTHGQGPPMLVMHGGLGLDHTYFRPWLDVLGKHLELVYYDHRGNGRSSRPERWQDLDCETWVDDADALRADLGYERILLLGHSYGGFLAQEYALRFGDRLAGLILCSTGPAQDYPEVILANAEARATPEQARVVEEVFSAPVPGDAQLKQAMESVLPLYFHDYQASFGVALIEGIEYSAEAFNRFFFDCVPAFNTLGRLHEIAAPTLVLGGRSDWIVPPAFGPERLHAGLPDSELVIFERSGHFPFVEQQPEFAAAVEGWITRLS